MTTTNDVLDYVLAWRTVNGIGATDLLTQAQKAQFAQNLNNKIAEVPALYDHQSQAQMIAYSGTLTNAGGTVGSYQVAAQLSAIDNTQHFYISDTPRSAFIASDNFQFQQAIRAVLNTEEDFNKLFYGDANTQYSFGGQLALNDFISDSLIRANPVKGNFAPLLGQNLQANSVFMQTELKAVFDDPGYTHIYGIPKNDWINVLAIEGEEALISNLSTASTNYRILTGLEFEVSTDVNGRSTVTSLNAGEFLDEASADILTNYNAHPQAIEHLSAYWNSLDEQGRLDYEALQQDFKATGVRLADGGLAYHLNKFGIAADVLDFVLVGASAAQLAGAGNQTQATQLLKDWALETLAGSAGGLIGGKLASATLTEIAAAVFGVAGSATPFGWLGKGLIYGAAFIGGYIAGDKVDEFFQLFEDRDPNGQRDIIDKLADLFFGADANLNTITHPNNGTPFGFTAQMSRDDIVSLAINDIAYRYALQALNPFTLFGPDYETRHNQDGALTLYNPNTGLGNMSEIYLKDRAAMLTWKIRYDTGMLDDDDTPHNGAKPYHQDWDTSGIEGDWHYIDHTLKTNGNPLTLTIDGTDVGLYAHQIAFGSKHNDTIHGAAGNDHLYGMTGNDLINGDDGDDYIEGNLGNDTLTGGNGDDQMYGGTGNDQLYGEGGNDTLNGGLGADTLQGGANDDTYLVDNPGDLITELANEGTDLVQSSISYTLTANVEHLTLTGTAHINGTGNALNNTLIGNSGNNRLEGGAGNDMLIGAAGNDTMAGGDGDDIYAVNSTGDVMIETAGSGSGRDTVYTTASITMAANIEDLVVDLTATLTVTGNALNNTMHGNAMNNTIKGGTGHDTLRGFAGNDTLWGDLSTLSTQSTGGGNDTLYGGEGADNLYGESGNDTLYGDTGADLLDGGYGNDTLYGGEGADTLTGGFGHDILHGGQGMDTYLFAQISPLSLNTLGLDTIIDEDMAGKIIIGANTIVTGIKQSNGTWKTNTGDILTVQGDINAGRVTLTIQDSYNKVNISLQNFSNGDLGITLGGLTNNHFIGTDGNDTLTGNTNANTLTGKKGNDTYTINHSGDKVIEQAGASEGIDTVNSSIASYELTANVEHLTLIGSAITGIGNAMNNAITGNALNNTLMGQGGADTLTGGQGNDTLTGGAGADTFVFEALIPGIQDTDLITDFMLDDILDLSAIDANTTLLGIGNQAFNFIGNNAFSNTAGELNFIGNVLSGDVNGDGMADFYVQLMGVSSLQVTSLVL